MVGALEAPAGLLPFRFAFVATPPVSPTFPQIG